MHISTDYELLKKIINEEDPLGLIDSDTPESLTEYDPELKEIFKNDVSNLDRVELSDRIYQVFVSYFNEKLANGRDKYDSIAKKFVESRHNKT